MVSADKSVRSELNQNVPPANSRTAAAADAFPIGNFEDVERGAAVWAQGLCQRIMQKQHRALDVAAESCVAVLRSPLETPAPDQLLVVTFGQHPVEETFVISNRWLQPVKDQSFAGTDWSNVEERVFEFLVLKLE
jgi:hypothetical protein